MTSNFQKSVTPAWTFYIIFVLLFLAAYMAALLTFIYNSKNGTCMKQSIIERQTLFFPKFSFGK